MRLVPAEQGEWCREVEVDERTADSNGAKGNGMRVTVLGNEMPNGRAVDERTDECAGPEVSSGPFRLPAVRRRRIDPETGCEDGRECEIDLVVLEFGEFVGEERTDSIALHTVRSGETPGDLRAQ